MIFAPRLPAKSCSTRIQPAVRSLKTWNNPWTGKTLEVMQVVNDPVNGSYSVVGRDDSPVNLPFEVIGKQWWLSMPVPLYPNPLAGNYQQYIGGTYHATELFNSSVMSMISITASAIRPRPQ